MRKLGGTLVLFNIVYLTAVSEEKMIYVPGTHTRTSIVECIKHVNLKIQNLVMIDKEVGNKSMASELIKHLGRPVQIKPIEIAFRGSSNFIVFSTDKYFYYQLLQKVSTHFKNIFIIIWEWNPKVREIDVYMRKILKVMWKFRIYGVFVLVEEENSNVIIYTHSPYGLNSCDKPGPPLLLDTWNGADKRFTTGMFQYEIRSQTSSLLKDFHGCKIKVLVRNRPPESVALPASAGSVRLGGIGGFILQRLTRRHNFTAEIKLVEDSWDENRVERPYALSNHTAHTLGQALLQKKFDIAFGVFTFLDELRSSEIEFSHFFLNENYAFHIPCGNDVEQSLWKLYSNEFSRLTWMSILFLYFAFSVILKVISTYFPHETSHYKSFGRNMLDLFAIHLDTTVNMKIVSNTTRVLLTFIMFYCMVLSVAYRASLKSFQMSDIEGRVMDSWEELERSNLAITGTLESYTILKNVGKGQPIIHELVNRFRVKTYSDFTDTIHDMAKKFDTAYFGPESVILYYNSLRNEGNRTYKQTICQISKLVAVSPASAFLLRRGSIFSKLIERVTMDFLQAGYSEQFAVESAVRATAVHNLKGEEGKHTLEEFRGAFVVLIMGLSAAALAFILEILLFQCKFYSKKSTYTNLHI